MSPAMFRVAAVFLLTAMLAACATPAGKERQVRDREAVQNRVAAGMQYLQLDQLNEARQHFSRALERDPNSAIAHNAMALLYKYEGDPENEGMHYRRALRIDKNYTAARNNYGILLYQQGDYEGAAREFHRAANDPNYGSRGGAFENLARSYAQLGQRKEAEEAYRRALRLGQPEVNIQPELVQLYLQQGKVQMASTVLQRYADDYPQQMDTAKLLWLSIQVAAAQKNTTQQARYEAELRQRHAGTPEHTLWQRWRAKQ